MSFLSNLDLSPWWIVVAVAVVFVALVRHWTKQGPSIKPLG